MYSGPSRLDRLCFVLMFAKCPVPGNCPLSLPCSFNMNSQMNTNFSCKLVSVLETVLFHNGRVGIQKKKVFPCICLGCLLDPASLILLKINGITMVDNVSDTFFMRCHLHHVPVSSPSHSDSLLSPFTMFLQNFPSISFKPVTVTPSPPSEWYQVILWHMNTEFDNLTDKGVQRSNLAYRLERSRITEINQPRDKGTNWFYRVN